MGKRGVSNKGLGGFALPVFFLFLMVFFLSNAAYSYAASVERVQPNTVEPNSTFEVVFKIRGMTPDKLFTLEDSLPKGFAVKDWNVFGSKESKGEISIRSKEGRFGWSFTPSSTTAIIKYTASSPSVNGQYEFNAVYFDPAGQGRSTKSILVKRIVCGDSVCDSGETPASCPSDCSSKAATPPKKVKKINNPPPAIHHKRSKGGALVVLIVLFLLTVFAVAAKFKLFSRLKSRRETGLVNERAPPKRHSHPDELGEEEVIDDTLMQDESKDAKDKKREQGPPPEDELPEL